MTYVKVNRYLERVLQEQARALDQGAITNVSEKSIRIRHMPL